MRIRSVIASALIVLLLVGTSASVALPESDAETEISSGIPTGILDKVVDYEAIAEILTGFVHSDTFFNMVYPTIKENLGWTEYETHKFLSKITITSGDVRNLIEFINALFNGGSLNDLRNTVAKLISGEMNYAEFQSLLAELGAPTYILILVTEDVFDKMVQLLSMNFEEVYNLVTGWIATPDAENYDNLISGNVDVFSDVEYTGSLYIADGTVLNFNGAGTITATGPVMISGTVTLRGNAQIVSVGEDASINLGMIHLAESPTKCTLSVKDGATLTYSTAIPEYGSPTDQELKIRAMIKSNGTLAASGEGSYSITFSNDDEVTPTLDVSLCTAPIFNYFKDVDYFSLGLIDLISSGRD